MWTREQIKSRAKDVLSYSYWPAFFVCIIMLITSATGSTNNIIGKIMYLNSQLVYSSTIKIVLITLTSVGIAIGIKMVIKFFVGYSIEVGGMKYFMDLSEGKVNLSNLGYCFKKDRFLKVVLTMLLKDVYIFLWTLLLIIPGIIKMYSYKFVPFILADNPKIGCARAIELSGNMTNGEKWNIFVLDLSFLGWYMLGMMACCIGVLFVKPYYYTTKTELYFELRYKAIQSGMTSLDELNLKTLEYENKNISSRIDFEKNEKEDI